MPQASFSASENVSEGLLVSISETNVLKLVPICNGGNGVGGS